MRRILARLGEDATFTHGTSAGSSVRGVFAAPYAVLPGGMGDAGFESSLPRFAVMAEDITDVAQGDTITRGSVDYEITAVQPDDPSGVTVLVLQQSA